MAWKNITDATAQTFKIGSGQKGKKIRVEATDPSGTVASPPVGPVTGGWYANGTQPALTVATLQTRARTQYDDYLAYTLVSDGMPAGMPAGAKRIKVPDGDPAWYGWTVIGGTLSEGMGYGLLESVWYANPDLPTGVYDPNAKANFDAQWTYVKHFLTVDGFMPWSIRHDGTVADAGDAADGNFDIAKALLLAHRLWGSGGSVDYGAEATAMINAIRDKNFTPLGYTGPGGPNVMMNGWAWGVDADVYMPDYFSPAWFREFGRHTGDTRWNDIIAKNYPLAVGYFFNNFAGGVVPDRCKRDGTIVDATKPDQYKASYNSVRMGFRLVADLLWNGTGAHSLAGSMTARAAAKAKGLWATGGAVKAPLYDLDLTTGATYSDNAGWGLFGACALVDQATFAAEIVEAIAADTQMSYYNMGVASMASAFTSGIAVPFTPATSPTLQANTDPPAGWENYTALDVSAGGEFFLNNDTDYKIVGQTVAGTMCRLRGGGDIVIMGMTRTIGTAGQWNNGDVFTGVEQNFGIEIRDEPGGVNSGPNGPRDGRIVHLEGVKMTSPVDAQGFLLNCSSAHVRLVNVRCFELANPLRFKNCDQRDGTNTLRTNHPDLIQAHSGYSGRIYGWKTLTIDGFTAFSGYQGIYLKQEANASLGNVTMRRVDMHVSSFVGVEQDAAANKTYWGGAMFWKNPEFPSTSTITFGESVYGKHHPNCLIQGGNYISRGRYWNTTTLVYVDEVSSNGKFTDLFQPPNRVTTGTDVTGLFAQYPDTNVTGKVYSGDPPNGEHIPASLVGAGYVR